jgi:FlaA1/EpsC-like NDP-sugar epimerase/ActR/RegA family two-component response regulator
MIDLQRYLSARSFALLVDLVAVAVANIGAFLIRFDWVVPGQYVPHLLRGIPVAIAAYLASFLIAGTYRSIWKYASIDDLWLIIKASALGASFNAVGVLLLGWRPYPRSVVVSTALLTLVIMGGVRLIIRSSAKWRRASPASGRARRVVIVGAGTTGESIAREIRANTAIGCDLIGFVDDDPRKLGATIHSAPVLGNIEDLERLATTHELQQAIIAIPKAGGPLMRRIAETCSRAGIEIRTMPSISQLMLGEGKIRYLRKLNIEGLLQREVRPADKARLAQFLRGKRVMVTGAGGSIGSELCRQLIELDIESLVMVERAENALYHISLEIKGRYPKASLTAALADVKHIPRMSEIFERTRPQVVFHAAAYKHVAILEDHPGEAVLNNVVGTRRLAEVARRHGVETFVLISTDKAAEPSNLLGATKRICEMYIVALNRVAGGVSRREMPRFAVVRFGNVLGSAGSVVPLFEKQIENGDAITITDPAVSRFLMTIPEAVGLVLESARMAGRGDVFVLDMGEPVKISQLADDVIIGLGLSRSEVARKFVGLRAGEKIHERLWEDGEKVVRSEHERILVIEQGPRSLHEMELAITQLERLAIQGNVKELLDRIHELVPSYQHRHQQVPFEVSDAGERHRVLVIDDDDRMCAVLEQSLGGTYEVAVAHSAAEGFERVKALAPTVILLDLLLPDQSGLDVCRTFRTDPESRDVAIILMTGYEDDQSVVTGLRAGADDYIVKPFKLEEMHARIEAVLRRTGPNVRVHSR